MSEKRIVASEEELKRSVARLQALMDEIPTGVLNVDLKGRITYVNKTILQRTGYSREELVGKNGFRLGLIPRETMKVLRKRMIEKLMGKPPSPLEIQFKRKDGEWMWLEIRGRALWEHGVPVGVQIVGEDITERKQAEKALRENEEKYKALFESLNDAAFLADVETGRILDTNKQGELLLGRTREEIIGIHQSQLHPPQMANKYRQRFLTHAQKGRAADYDGEVIRKDGSIVSVSISASPVNIGGKELIVGLFRDITERKQFMTDLEALQDIGTVLASKTDLSEMLPVILESLEKKLGYLFTALVLANRERNCLDNYMFGPSLPIAQISKMVGLDLAKASVSLTAKENLLVQTVLTGKPQFTHDIYDYGRPVVAKFLLAPIQKMFGIKLIGVVPLIAEEEVVGALSFARQTEKPITDQEMRTLTAFANHAGLAIKRARDITERKQAEEALRESEEKFRTIFQNVNDEIIYLDKYGKIIEVNKRIEDIFGYKPEEVIGKNFTKLGLFSLKDLPKMAKLFSEGIRGKVTHLMELGVKHKDGGIVFVEASTRLVKRDGKIEGILVIVRDITERKEAEEELRSFNKLAVDRELRMIELKKEINIILHKLGEEPRYKIVEENKTELNK